MTSPASIPVIDLRLLSQSEIADLARNDPQAYDLNRLNVTVPKIDRSIFNESAASRKQTYSRILKTSLARRRPSPDRGNRENELIGQFLRQLFEPDKFPPPLDTDPITSPSDRTPPQPRSDQNLTLALAALPPSLVRTAAATVAETSRALVVVEENKEKEVLNAEGMKTEEEEQLRFLADLDGKRKFVDGDVFPRGWEGAAGTEKEGGGAIYVLPEIYQPQWEGVSHLQSGSTKKLNKRFPVKMTIIVLVLMSLTPRCVSLADNI